MRHLNFNVHVKLIRNLHALLQINHKLIFQKFLINHIKLTEILTFNLNLSITHFSLLLSFMCCFTILPCFTPMFSVYTKCTGTTVKYNETLLKYFKCIKELIEWKGAHSFYICKDFNFTSEHHN